MDLKMTGLMHAGLKTKISFPILRPFVLSPFVLSFVLLSSCASLRASQDPWLTPEHAEVIERVQAAKAAEGRYARKLETELHEMLATLLPTGAIKVRVYLQLDFDQSSQTEQLVPEEQRLLEQRSSSQRKTNEEDLLSSEENRFQPAWLKSHVLYHPGRIQQLGLVVLIDQNQIGNWDARELTARLLKLLAAGSPYREERGDKLEVLVAPFSP